MKYYIPTDWRPSALDAVMARHGWQPTSGDDWDLHWGEAYEEVAASTQRVRHARHLRASPLLGGKASLGRHLEVARSRALAAGRATSWDFFPRTYEMPFEAEALRAEIRARPGQMWIGKPVTKACGDGHYLFGDPADAPTRAGWVAQEYLMRPHLIDGLKYSLRNFVLVTSLRPLTAYISTLGLAKRCSLTYTNAPEHWNDRAMHLSNVDVQMDELGQRLPVWQLDDYATWFESVGGDYAALWAETRRMATQVLLATRESWLKENPGNTGDLTRRFELLGIDVMLDDQLKPWLLETNTNPAMRARGQEGERSFVRECQTKATVMEEVLQLSGVLPGLPNADVPPQRFGSFELLFPCADAASWHGEWFPREEDRRLFRAVGFPEPEVPAARLPETALGVEDGVIAFAPPGDRFLALNETATAIALWHEEGRGQAEIATELVRAGAPSITEATAAIEPVLAEVWNFNVPQRPRESRCWPQPAPARDRGVVHHYALGAIRFAVWFEREEFARLAEDALAHLRVAADAGLAHQIEVTWHDPIIGVRSHREAFEVVEPRMFMATLHSAMLRMACCAPGVFAALHASVVARGGRALVLSGQSGRGKTTLATALAHSGFEFLSDEAALLDADFRVWPAPVAFGLTDGSLPLLSQRVLAPGRLLAPLLRRDSTAVHYLQPEKVASGPVPLGAVMFPRIAPGEPTRLEPVGLRAALGAIGEGGIEFPGTMDEGAIRRLVGGLQRVARYIVHVGSLADAVELLADWADGEGGKCP